MTGDFDPELEWLHRDRVIRSRPPLGPTELAEFKWKLAHPYRMTSEEWLRCRRLKAAGLIEDQQDA